MRLAIIALFITILSPGAIGQITSRSVHGRVLDKNNAPLRHVPVQIKNLKTLEIRSFLTEDDGRYYFHGLSPDEDYKLQVKYRNDSSTKSLSKFSSEKDKEIDFKIDTGS